MATIRELLIKLGVDADKQALERWDKAVDQTKEGMVKAVEWGAKLAVTLGAASAAAILNAKSVAEQATQIERQSRLLDTTQERYQELLYTVQQFGVDIGDLADVYVQLAQVQQDALSGNKNAKESFKALGIEVKELKGLSPDQIFRLMAERAKDATDQTLWLSKAGAILGEEGVRQFGPQLLAGVESLDALAAQARETGVVMSETALKDARAYGAELGRLKGAGQGLRNTLALALIPALTQGTKRAADFVIANREWLGSKAERAAELFGAAVERIEKGLERLGDGDKMEGLKRVIGGVASALGAAGIIKVLGVVGPLLHAVFGLGFAGAAVLLAKVVAVVAIFAALGLAIEDVITYFRGGDSLIGRFINRLREGGGHGSKVVGILERLGRVGRLVFAILERAAGAAFERIKVVAEPVLNGIGMVLQKVWEDFASPIIDMLLNDFDTLFNLIEIGLTYTLNNWDNLFSTLGEWADAATSWMADQFEEVFDFIEDKLDALFGTLARVREAVHGVMANLGGEALIGVGDAALALGGGASPQLAARDFGAANQRASASGGVVDNSTTTLNIQQAPGQDPKELALEVDRRLEERDKRSRRQLRASAAGREM